jgi:hypothetical protein
VTDCLAAKNGVARPIPVLVLTNGSDLMEERESRKQLRSRLDSGCLRFSGNLARDRGVSRIVDEAFKAKLVRED